MSKEASMILQSPSRSLRFKIIIMLLVCAGGLLLVTMVYNYLNQKRQLQDELNLTADTVVNRLAFTMSQPLWNFDQKHLEDLELQELKAPSVRSVLVMASDSSLLNLGQKKTLSVPEDIQPFSSYGEDAKGTLHREKPILYGNLTIGTVHVTLSDEPIKHKLTSLLIQQTLQFLIILAGISLLTYLWLSRILLKRLCLLGQAAEKFGSGDLETRFTVSGTDEIGSLGSTMGSMATQLTKTIGGLKQVEKELQVANLQLYNIIECIPDAMFVIDSESIIIAWNRALEEMTGISSEAALGKTPLDFTEMVFGARRPAIIGMLDCSDEEISQHPGSFRRVGDKIIGEVFLSCLNGKLNQYFWGVAAPLCDEKGNRRGALQIIRNTTEQKQAELALRESEEFRKQVFEGSRVAIGILDGITHRFLDCNQATVAIFGFDCKQDFLGKTPLDVSTSLQVDGSASREAATEHIASVMEKGMEVFEWRHVRTNGDPFDAEVHLMSFTVSGKQLLQFTLHDITERKKTAALMIQTEKMMMVGGLAAGMAHEINNPLGIITQTVQNIQRRLDPKLSANQAVANENGIDLVRLQQYLESRQIFKFITSVREATDRAARIVANMLKFSRKSESHTEYVELGMVFDQVLELAASDYDLRKNYDFKRVTIVREMTADLSPIPVSVLEFEQVLLNLLKNAAQAMYETEIPNPQITLRADCKDGFAVIEVEDNGPGMPQEVQKRIFEPFYTTKEVGKGTGLGLSVSYSIITNNHGGRLEVRSQPGAGTCFTIRLPLKRSTRDTQGVSA